VDIAGEDDADDRTGRTEACGLAVVVGAGGVEDDQRNLPGTVASLMGGDHQLPPETRG
jgi:hypothetical protein